MTQQVPKTEVNTSNSTTGKLRRFLSLTQSAFVLHSSNISDQLPFHLPFPPLVPACVRVVDSADKNSESTLLSDKPPTIFIISHLFEVPQINYSFDEEFGIGTEECSDNHR